MRVLFSSTRGAGHFNPLVPFARAFERAGHEVMVAGPPVLADTARGAGFEFRHLDPPPEDEHREGAAALAADSRAQPVVDAEVGLAERLGRR